MKSKIPIAEQLVKCIIQCKFRRYISMLGVLNKHIGLVSEGEGGDSCQQLTQLYILYNPTTQGYFYNSISSCSFFHSLLSWFNFTVFLKNLFYSEWRLYCKARFIFTLFVLSSLKAETSAGRINLSNDQKQMLMVLRLSLRVYEL